MAVLAEIHEGLCLIDERRLRLFNR